MLAIVHDEGGGMARASPSAWQRDELVAVYISPMSQGELLAPTVARGRGRIITLIIVLVPVR